tara:strand:+ start:103 stop:351 length:249 start_codon:yes stop_codon:yes gene_type:complete
MKYKKNILEKKLTKIFKKVFKVGNLSNKSLTYNNLSNWDSLQHIILIKEIEKTFKIRIDDLSLPELISFSKIMNYIEKKNDK